MKVIIAIDTTSSSEVILDQVLSRPWPPETKMCLLNMVDTQIMDTSFVGIETLTKFQIEMAESYVETVAKKFEAKGFSVESHILEGYPQQGILDFAEKWNADFIFLGTHGHNRFTRFLLGSTSKTILRAAHCSVAIIRENKANPQKKMEEGMNILLATDGSETAQLALQSVLMRPWPKPSQIRVVSVCDLTLPVADPTYITPGILDQMRDEILRVSQAALENSVEALRQQNNEFSVALLRGYPKSEILDEAQKWKPDLIILGSHGRRGFSRFLMGSVSEAVALYAPCSVEVIRSSPWMA